MKLQPVPEWHWDARCGKRNPRLYDTSSLQYSSLNQNYFIEARDRCKECPVLQKCAAEALRDKEIAVIRAGVPLLDYVEQNEIKGRYDLLRHIAETGEHPPMPEPQFEGRDETPVCEHLPPIKSAEQFLFQNEWYVSRYGASELLGVSPKTLDNYRRIGKLDLTPRYIRRTENKGQGGAYYLVDRLLEEKEKLFNARAVAV